MATIRAAVAADLSAVSDYLANALRGDGGAPRYRRFLDYAWLPSKPDLGVLIEDEGRIRGFIGAIYSDRRFGAEVHRLCNLTSIAVDPSHRKLSLQMFGALFKHKQLSFTCFSASDDVAKILDFFKFEHRATEKIVVAPISGLASLPRALRTRVVTRPDELDRELPDDQRAIARDHRAYRCGQLLIVDGDRRSFAVTIRRGRGARAFADVLYASDPELLVAHLPRIHLPLFRAHRTVLTGIERSWVQRPPRVSFTYAKLRPVYLRSASLRLDQIDALYSELVPMFGH